ncbi:apolipoprotein N-acyltransferase [Psychroflexus sp. YR1-1]|uniref:Apolipoprotein N-acyltransferase n=1 Tax=Psychroflexus aurantiacus TaxID=2709310 RepID=A0A6B3R0G9_9FLAO|nr:apolipoprotein N-acyltransferase [Psychroflexus aurantiacus]NEV93672.1 apolipoprotein N-acyltransferase [Psychroflexus aurantiacus]
MKHILLALASGLLLALSWPTNGLSVLSFIGFLPLLLAEFNLRKSNIKRINLKVFGLAYLSFFTWNVVTTYWLYFSTPFGGIFAILANSLLMSLVFLLYHIVAKRVAFTAASSFFIALWLSFEKLHLSWEFSWPWLNLGNVFASEVNFIQWYEYTGTFGGSLWILITNFILFKGILLYQQHKESGLLLRTGVKLILIIALPITLSLLIRPETDSENSIETLSLQPNIDPYTEKYDTNNQKMSGSLIKLTQPLLTDEPQLLIAPETVFAEGIDIKNYRYSQAKGFARDLLSENEQLNILFGISMYEILRDESQVSGQSNVLRKGVWFNDYNSAVFERKGVTEEFYHKSKLVVGVENFPYQSTLKPLLGDIMIDLGGTVAMKTTQEDRSVFRLNTGHSVAPIICYESVYGEFVAGYVSNGANALAIITNDAWWGDTQGHKQHWIYAKLRAIETRRAVARSANTGISGFIDRDGSVLKKSNYNEKTILKYDLPLYEGETFYVQHGDYIPRISNFLALFILLFAVTRRRT